VPDGDRLPIPCPFTNQINTEVPQHLARNDCGWLSRLHRDIAAALTKVQREDLA